MVTQRSIPAVSLVDENGVAYGIKHDSNRPLVGAYFIDENGNLYGVKHSSNTLLTGAYFVDENGALYGVKHSSNRPLIGSYLVDDSDTVYGVPKDTGGLPRINSQPYRYRISEGLITGHDDWSMFGANPDVDNVEETVWSVGGSYVPPTAGMQLEVVSTSNEDSGAGGVNPAGTGIRQIHIHYLDDTWTEQEEVVTLDGTTVVTTTADDILRVNLVHQHTVGSSKAAVGTIDIRHLSNTPIYARIDPTKNRSAHCFYTVPIGKTVYITDCLVGGGNALGNRFLRFTLSMTQNLDKDYEDGVWYDYAYMAVQDGGLHHIPQIPLKVVAKVDIKALVVSDSGTANALTAANCFGWIETN